MAVASSPKRALVAVDPRALELAAAVLIGRLSRGRQARLRVAWLRAAVPEALPSPKRRVDFGAVVPPAKRGWSAVTVGWLRELARGEREEEAEAVGAAEAMEAPAEAAVAVVPPATALVVPTWTAADLKVAGMALPEGEVALYGGNVQWVLALPGEPGPPERRAPKMGMASVAECSRCGSMYPRRNGCFCRFGIAPRDGPVVEARAKNGLLVEKLYY